MAVAARYTGGPGVVQPTPGAAAPGTAVETRRLSTTVFLAGILTMLTGAWGALAPMVGPEFGFVADRTKAFTPTQINVWLSVVPGAVAVVCGVIIAGSARSALGRLRPDLWMLGFVAALAGAWFCIGQYAWQAMGGHRYLAPAGATMTLWKQFGFTVGVGIVLVALGAMTMGWSARKTVAPVVSGPYPRIVPVPASTPVTPAAPGRVPAEPVAATAPMSSTMAPGAMPSTMAPPDTTRAVPVVPAAPQEGMPVARDETGTPVADRIGEVPPARVTPVTQA